MFYKTIKRIIDITGSVIGLIILLPFFPFITLAIKIDSFLSLSLRVPPKQSVPLCHSALDAESSSFSGFHVRHGITERLFKMTTSPVLIKLDRVSEGKIIKVYKFRSMIVGAAEKKKDLLKLNERKDGPFFKIKNDPRITKVGKFLRKFRIDEFPQLINVLKGELSLVGPRPHEPEELFAYPREYRELLTAKTGLTGLSQVNGASGLPFLKELEYDKYYLENQSLWLDFKILFKTLVIFFTDPTGV